MNQLHQNLVSHEEKVLVEIYQRLTQQQNELCGAIVNTIEHNFKVNTGVLKRPTSDVGGVQSKLSKLDIGLGMSNIETPISIRRRADPLIDIILNKSRIDCYENWDNIKHKQLVTELKLVDFKTLDNIFDTIHKKWFKDGIVVESLGSLTPEDMTLARRAINTLKVFTVNKFQRFPSTGTFIDINLASKQNADLRMMFVSTRTSSFYYAAKRYRSFIKDNALDLWVFENIHELQWKLVST